MNRRRFLTMAGGASTIAMSGCASFLDQAPPQRPWPESQTVEDPDGVHDLYVENHTERTEAAWLRVARDDDTVLVDARYELPDGRAIQFADLAVWERTYTIDIAINGEDRRSFEWSTPECGPSSESPGDTGSRNAAVRVESPDQTDARRLSLRVDECDAIQTGTIPTGSAEYFRLDG